MYELSSVHILFFFYVYFVYILYSYGSGTVQEQILPHPTPCCALFLMQFDSALVGQDGH